MIKITPDFVKQYVYGKYSHPAYHETCMLANRMRIHADGLFPAELIGKRRPSESLAVFNYRQQIYEPQTQQPFSKIMNSLAKIRKSQDFVIQWDQKKVSAKIAKGETLEDYCDKNFPTFGSVTNWTFSVLLKQYLIDPNSIIVFLPESLVVEAGEYYKPIPVLFDSHQVIDYISNELAVVTGEEKIFIEGEKEGKNIYYFFTKDELWRAMPDNNGNYQLLLIFQYNLGVLPCRQIRAVFDSHKGNELIYKSRLFACLPSWNEAVREYSDMQASVTKHMFPTMVIHTNQRCPKCSGAGKELKQEGKGNIQVPCSACGGSGSIPRSPYEDIEIKAQKAGEVPLPSPIAYYVEKDTNIIKIQDERIDKHLLKAYSAINFDFLGVGLNQSGIAKEWDRSEMNTFVDNIAEDIVGLMDSTYYYCALWRYKYILTDQQINEQLPHIPVPEKYDIVSETYLADQLEKVKKIGANSFLVAALELEFAQKKFNTNKGINDLIKLSLKLDPLAGVSQADKDSQKMNGGITKENYIISTMINYFIKKAIAQDEKFMDKTYEEQMDKMKEYAQEQLKQDSESEKIKSQIDPLTGLPISA